MRPVSRRRVLALIPAAVVMTGGGSARVRAAAQAAPHDLFPRHDPALALEMVGASHGNVARVKELIGMSPAFANASWDWGFGDWETALGAASHVGNKEIAALLLASGAQPTIFSAAMLGQLDTVKAFVSAAPGIQRTRGPHGIALLAHARAGGNAATIAYLESLGDANPTYPNQPLSDEDMAGLLGAYTYGTGATHRLLVERNSRGLLIIKREGESNRNLFHHGGRVFNPAGAETVRIRFEPVSGRATTVVVTDGPLVVRAGR